MKLVNILTIILFLSYLRLDGQVLEVVNGLNEPRSFHFIGNDLYFSELNDGNGRISKIDISENNPTISEILTGLQGPEGIE